MPTLALQTVSRHTLLDLCRQFGVRLFGSVGPCAVGTVVPPAPRASKAGEEESRNQEDEQDKSHQQGGYRAGAFRPSVHFLSRDVFPRPLQSSQGGSDWWRGMFSSNLMSCSPAPMHSEHSATGMKAAAAKTMERRSPPTRKVIPRPEGREVGIASVYLGQPCRGSKLCQASQIPTSNHARSRGVTRQFPSQFLHSGGFWVRSFTGSAELTFPVPSQAWHSSKGKKARTIAIAANVKPPRVMSAALVQGFRRSSAIQPQRKSTRPLDTGRQGPESGAAEQRLRLWGRRSRRPNPRESFKRTTKGNPWLWPWVLGEWAILRSGWKWWAREESNLHGCDPTRS